MEVFLEVAAWEKRIKGGKTFEQVVWLGKGLVEEIALGKSQVLESAYARTVRKDRKFLGGKGGWTVG